MNQITMSSLRTSLRNMQSKIEQQSREQDSLIAEQGRLNKLHAENETQLHINLRAQEKFRLLEDL
ncbi:hypothetical protein ACET8U_22610 [Aeromonas veronii]